MTHPPATEVRFGSAATFDLAPPTSGLPQFRTCRCADRGELLMSRRQGKSVGRDADHVSGRTELNAFWTQSLSDSLLSLPLSRTFLTNGCIVGGVTVGHGRLIRRVSGRGGRKVFVDIVCFCPLISSSHEFAYHVYLF